jgi:mRNA interferase RelE/StbE
LASYEVEFKPKALKQIGRLSERDARRIMDRVLVLAGDPRPRGCTKLESCGSYRIRVGDHRVIYTVHDEVLTVFIIRVAHRRDAYR